MNKFLHSTKIIGTGSYLPEIILDNKDLARHIRLTPNWIEKRSGIHLRHLAKKGQSTSDLATRAAQKAIEMAEIKAQNLDMVIASTMTPSNIMPSTASEVQYKLGFQTGMAFDLNAASSGFPLCPLRGQPIYSNGYLQKYLSYRG